MSPCDQYQAAEVAWYRANGKYRDRIKHGSSGPYVAGDWSWNRSNPDRHEIVEPMMTSYVLGDLERERMSDPIERIREGLRTVELVTNDDDRWQVRIGDIRALLDRLDAAEAENERLREDGERYRFIRDNSWPSELVSVIQMQQNGKWDAAIDAARREK